MKNLANCSPVEFLVQSNKIRKSVESWLELTKVAEIRKNMPEIPEGATKEQINELIAKQGKENIRKMLDSMLEEHPKETAELLGLLCFIEPKDLEEHKMVEIIGSVNDILNSKEVIDFFTSLMQSGLIDTSKSAKT